jgi:hypothetical protein
MQVYEVVKFSFQSKSSWTAPGHKQVFKQIFKIANLSVDFNGSKLLLVVYSSNLSSVNWLCFRFFSSLSNFAGHLTLKEDVLLFEVCAIFTVQSKNIVVHVSKGINFI